MEIVVRSPSSGEVIATLQETTSEQIREAMYACRRAQHDWARLTLKQRSSAIARLRDVLAENHQEVVDLISRENGKPRFEALAGEVMASIDFIAYFEKLAPRLLRPKEIRLGTPLLPHRQSWLEYDPLGVIAIISPWNFPWLLPFAEVVTALLAGNAVIIKPSEATPLCGLKIQELCERAGLPKGLVATIIGDGRAGAELIQARPDKIFFTGSVPTGKKIMAAAAEHLIPVNLELGGKDAMVILDDADLDLASSAALWGSMFNLGQVCASVERILVHEKVADEFTRLLVDKVARLRDEDLGSITFEKQKSLYDAHLAEAREKGAKFLTGGKWTGDRTRLHPTIISGEVIEKLQVYQEETFGPVVALTKFTSDDQAVAKVNDSRYGLTASVYSRDLRRARAIASRLHAGTITINETLYTAGVPGTPWGGWKESGMGRTHHDEGVFDFVQLRHVHAPRWAWASFKSFWWYPYTKNQMATFRHLTLRHRFGLANKLRAWLGAAWHFIQMVFTEPRL